MGDLGGGARAVLEGLQVAVTRLDACTACDQRFFSHRRQQGRAGRQAGVIWLEPASVAPSPGGDGPVSGGESG